MSDFTKDIDVLETQEWLEAFEDVIKEKVLIEPSFYLNNYLLKVPSLV